MPNPPHSKPVHPMPFVRIELAVLAVSGDRLQVILGKRSEAPYAGRWALPGGVLRIDLDVDLDAACQRVARERLGVELPGAQPLGAVGGRARDPRAPWALSVVYLCATTPAALAISPGKRLEELKWVEASVAAADERLALDHAQLVGRAADALRGEVDALRFPKGLMAEPFTLADLQATSQAVLGDTRKLEKSSFRRRIDAAGCVEAVQGALKTGAFRPAQLFRLR